LISTCFCKVVVMVTSRIARDREALCTQLICDLCQGSGVHRGAEDPTITILEFSTLDVR
jgi:hypothetical protein